MWSPGRVEINRIEARVAGEVAGSDRTAIGLRLSHALSSAELQPASIPPSAILVVRRLSGPAPAGIAPWEHAAIDVRWERTVRERLEQRGRDAVRPSGGWIPEDAEAVLFLEPGELIARLSWDLVRGRVAAGWWWKALRRTLGSVDGLAAVLRRQARYLPAALEHLVAWGIAAPVLRSLRPVEVRAVVSAMCEALELVDAGAVLALPRRGDAGGGSITDLGGGPGGLVGEATPVGPNPAPWVAQLPAGSVPMGLEPAAECLAGLALLAQRRPAAARSRALMPALRGWWLGLEPETGELGLAEGGAQAGVGVPDAAAGVPRREGAPEGSRGSSPGAGEGAEPEAPKRGVSEGAAEGRSAPAAPTFDRAVFDPTGQAGIDPGRGEASPGEGSTASHHAESGSGPAGKTPASVPASSSVRSGAARTVARELEAGVETGLAGVFYLVNLMQRLELPGCFEAHWRLASTVGSWGVLDALARALLEGGEGGRGTSPDQAAIAADPVWAALASLDGRECGELPGAALRAAGTYHLPSRWFGQLRGDGALRWATAGGVLRVWSEDGFLLVEQPAEGGAPRAALEPYRFDPDISFDEGEFGEAPFDPVSSPLLQGANPALVRWLERVLPALRRRLRLAIAPEAAEIERYRMLFACPARLFVSACHVDVVMRLRDISVPVRMAGLDRDPGWQPAFGRVVQFYFE